MSRRREQQRYKDYKSPPRKLLGFFEQSRDQWKAKHREAKATVKRLKNRVRFLEKSKAHWKSKAQELERELAQLQAQERAREEELEAQKKTPEMSKDTSAGSVHALAHIENFDIVPARQQYTLGHILLYVSLVLTAATSLRCASRVIELVSSSWQLSLTVPLWQTGRLWLLRLGYYKLMRAKEQADDWVWIVDHTVQLGAEKCLVILGIRLSALPPAGSCLKHTDVEPLALFPVTKSNGEIVWQQLEETVAKTGVPREIIGDHGSDLKSGVEKFCQAHPETSYLYDIKHKTAAVLKHELQVDEDWVAFTQLATQTKKRVQQTSLAALAPPNQRSKARYMNVDLLIGWGNQMLTFLAKQAQIPSAEFEQEQVAEKLAWVTDFREQLAEWGTLLQLITTTESFVRTQGLSHDCQHKLEKHLADLGLTHTERTKKVHAQLLAFVAQEASQAKSNERLLGSSEVVESVFGKLKRLEQDQAKSGFTALLLSVAAMLSATTGEVIQEALETVRTKQVLEWCKDTLGKSTQAKRREAFAPRQKAEQKRDQFSPAL